MSEEDRDEKHGEFERQPVPDSKTRGLKAFVGMYAGEHCAGTELMLGPLFVAAGVSAFDLVFGLLLGNLLAVMSWMFLCAPIAVRARLTLYYQLEKICGRNLVTLYNLANGVMFCFLAGSMVTVSATALGVWFKFPMPGLSDLYPNSVGWVVAVLAVGIVISLVAAWGYDMVARVANIAAPWMVLVFLAFGIIGFRQFIEITGSEVNSFASFWELCRTSIWKGGDPLPGQVKFTFWHVTFFAWFCNMAMHIGMSDLSVFRFARKSWHSVASASGMYVGHFMAWIAASILYALQLHMDAANTDVLPGPLAYRAAGIAGLICVIVAGWTTANPTIYRAGLAFQAIMPRVSRFKVTLATGMIATLAGMFPAIAMRLLGFVALYGLVLMPMGAVVFIDFWVLERIGLKSNFAELKKLSFSPAAGVAWIATFIICIMLVLSGKPYFQIYFVSLPGWFVASILYIAVSYIHQKDIHLKQSFRLTAQVVSWAALAGIVIPGLLFAAGNTTLEQVKGVMTVSTVIWFISSLCWMGRDKQATA
jgi:purine-cytosine permease-like protein